MVRMFGRSSHQEKMRVVIGGWRGGGSGGVNGGCEVSERAVGVE